MNTLLGFVSVLTLFVRVAVGLGFESKVVSKSLEDMCFDDI